MNTLQNDSPALLTTMVQDNMVLVMVVLAVIIIFMVYFFTKQQPMEIPKQKTTSTGPILSQTSDTTGNTQSSDTATITQTQPKQLLIPKSEKELSQLYEGIFQGSISLKSTNNTNYITALCLNKDTILLANSRNYLVLYDKTNWEKQQPNRYYTSLGNDTASALAISPNYYFVALNFNKTISYYSFKGGKGGTYFHQQCQFPYNTLKSAASSLYVPSSQQYIVSSGGEMDTVIYIWSMKGEKITSMNTYQIEHYSVNYSEHKIIVSGWTSQVKIFNIDQSKQGGNFEKIEKNYHLPHNDHPTFAVIDPKSLYACTVTKTQSIFLWNIHNQQTNHHMQSTIHAKEINIDTVNHLAISTFKSHNDRYRTVVVIGDGYKMVLCDNKLRMIQKIQGLDCKEVYIFGSWDNVSLYMISHTGRLLVWNITSLVHRVEQYVI